MKRVLVIGGSEEFVGAPYLAGIAALRAGAESVIVMAPENVAWAINALSPDLMTRKLRGKWLSRAHLRAIRAQMRTADILVLGNGAGVRPETAALMRSLMRTPILKVVDADALKVLCGIGIVNAILTPNEREWKLLMGQNEIQKLLAANSIVRKGFPTVILTGLQKFTLRTNKGLSKAGTGDVLAGMIAGFLACGLSPLAASMRACAVGNDIANILTKKRRGYDFLASDLAAALPFSRMKLKSRGVKGRRASRHIHT